jgi:peptide/nickel transport system permease protein
MKQIRNALRELMRYPTAVAGIILILILTGISIYALISLPYAKAVYLWRGTEDVWYRNPKFAAPEWVNLFRKEKLAKSIALDTREGTATKEVEVDQAKGQATYTMTFPFDYEADVFPQEMILYFHTKYKEKKPYASIVWTTPDGREIRIGDFSFDDNQAFWFSQDKKLKLRVNNLDPLQGLLVDDLKSPTRKLQKGHYLITMKVISFETDATVDAEFVMHGQVAGWAGTDHLRRDLGIALLWGTPIALSFGLVAALMTTLAQMAIAAFGVWYGGWIDELIQRVTEVNLVLPALPIYIMIGTFYSRSIFVIFGAVIALSLFGGAVKSLRATFLQIKEAPFIEAARAYGAGNTRIIFQYLIPRLIPLLIPSLVTAIPGYVFLEASLAVLGLGDPVLPTWGKMINDASANGALYKGLYYWVLQPSALLMVAGLAFALLGFSLDRVFNPRLRGM